MRINYASIIRQAAMSGVLFCCVGLASAALFEDDDARKAILDLRQRTEAARLQSEQGIGRANEDNATLRRSLLELQNQIELLRSETAKLRGLNEQLSRDVAETQRQQKNIEQFESAQNRSAP